MEKITELQNKCSQFFFRKQYPFSLGGELNWKKLLKLSGSREEGKSLSPSGPPAMKGGVVCGERCLIIPEGNKCRDQRQSLTPIYLL